MNLSISIFNNRYYFSQIQLWYGQAGHWREFRRERTSETRFSLVRLLSKRQKSKKKKSQIRLNLRLLAEMVGFEPTCPIKDKTISSRSRYDHFDTSPYSNHAVERSANIHTANPTALSLYQKSRLPSTGFHCRRGGRTQHQHARMIGIGQPVAADFPHKFPPVVEIFAKYYYFKAILYKRLPGSL